MMKQGMPGWEVAGGGLRWKAQSSMAETEEEEEQRSPHQKIKKRQCWKQERRSSRGHGQSLVHIQLLS